ncbi:MAG: flagellar protein FlaG [Synergistaceae bacterium]|nr:flagellar protein FlaG [Synergistaceae bacterium]MBQ9628185.1 flagellar protein FlaG [Synergistaceae bacterium]MBR0069472.1 flagellar protein FlaG [Synergistaceae bacterium]MBR0250383.1 flagellar protein FlaG [Synergistaceae bacterium]
MGFITSDPVLYSHSPAAEIQRQVIRTKTLGNVYGSPPSHETESEKAEIKEAKVKQSKSDAIAQKAQKARAENIDRAAAMRHLRYEVITDADIVQVSVINSEDGTIIRKVPPDKVIGFVKKFREKTNERRITKRKYKLDIQA